MYNFRRYPWSIARRGRSALAMSVRTMAVGVVAGFSGAMDCGSRSSRASARIAAFGHGDRDVRSDGSRRVSPAETSAHATRRNSVPSKSQSAGAIGHRSARSLTDTRLRAAVSGHFEADSIDCTVERP